MSERPIYKLSRRHRPDNRLSFHKFIAAEIVPVVWTLEAFPAPGSRDRALFRGWEKPRDCEVDGRCQFKLYRVRCPAGLK